MLSSLLVQDLFLPLFSFFLFSSFIVRLLSLLAYKCTLYTWLDCGSQKDEICYLQVPEREEELEFSVSVRQDNLLSPEGGRWGGLGDPLQGLPEDGLPPAAAGLAHDEVVSDGPQTGTLLPLGAGEAGGLVAPHQPGYGRYHAGGGSHSPVQLQLLPPSQKGVVILSTDCSTLVLYVTSTW